MRTIIGVTCCLFCLCLAGVSGRAPAQEERQKDEQFSALAYLPSGAGRAMLGSGATASVDVYIDDYSSDQEAKEMAGALLAGGSDALLKMLEKAKTKGRITLTGRVGSYDLKLIRSRRTKTGRRIYAVGDRPMGFLEIYSGSTSQDYPFGILTLDLKRDKKGNEKGEGVLVYAAKVKVLDGKKIDVENYGVSPVRLLSVRKL
ncbi:MAG: hypothetical protein JO360_00525 [Acidobacteria bacterium]|nr:hypothetical protein [Acidobacteriota bacterium]